MPTTTTPFPNVPLPAGTRADTWQDDEPPYRVIFGADRTIPDHAVRVSPAAIQFTDGSFDDVEAPSVSVLNGDTDTGINLNSDQARELAAVLLEAAAELDGWVGR
jgi:hypothetical protein